MHPKINNGRTTAVHSPGLRPTRPERAPNFRWGNTHLGTRQDLPLRRNGYTLRTDRHIDAHGRGNSPQSSPAATPRPTRKFGLQLRSGHTPNTGPGGHLKYIARTAPSNALHHKGYSTMGNFQFHILATRSGRENAGRRPRRPKRITACTCGDSTPATMDGYPITTGTVRTKLASSNH